MKLRHLVKQLDRLEQSQAVVCGWIQARRDHGGLIFFDLRDHSGLIQLVIRPETEDLFDLAQTLRSEWVVKAGGLVRRREAGMVNPNLATGHLEIQVSQLEVLSRSKTPPFSLTDSGNVAEDTRLRYRYLDLRRQEMQAQLSFRSKFYGFIRQFMADNSFTEVPTPVLANCSPEGARDFLVPSRIHPHKLYALPQAPQQFKQLLMVGGLDRYYQIAPVFRDEDPRSDRLYGEFYQLDLEVAFVEDGQEIRDLVEPLIKSMVTDFGRLKLQDDQIKTLTYQQAMADYGSDKPDLRYGLKLHDLSPDFQHTKLDIFQKVLQAGGAIKALAAEAVFSHKEHQGFLQKAQSLGSKGLAYCSLDKDLNWQGPIAKFLDRGEKDVLRAKLGLKPEQTVFICAGPAKTTDKVLGDLRAELGRRLELADPELVSAVWIVDFPFYELDDDSQQLDFAHNPFSRPTTSLETDDKLAIKADQFDLVMNGYEVLSGATRNHEPEVLKKAFQLVGYSEEEIKTKFGALLTAFEYGAPPHGGCAFGLDRLLMILSRETNIRQTIAFPKNGSGVDLMMGSPSKVGPEQLKELKIKWS